MNRPARLAYCCALLAAAAPASAAGPEDAAVKVFATVRYPNPVRPWTSGNPADVAGTGTVIEGKRILTNAHVVLYATEVRVQARPGDEKVEAKIEFVAPGMDLAVLSVKDETFFRKRPPVPRATTPPKVQDAVTVYGFPIGGDDLSVTNGVVSRVEYGPFYPGGIGLIVQVSAAINPGNSGGPAVAGGKLVGVVTSRLREAENIGYLIPAAEIETFLEDIKDGKYDGKLKDVSRALYQVVDNQALRKHLQLDAAVKGGLMVHTPARPGPGYPFKEFDVIVKVGDRPLDRDGMIVTPDGLRATFDALIPALAKDGIVPLTVVRQGRPTTVALPVGTRVGALVPAFAGEKLPYFIHGPLTFAPARSDSVALYNRLRPGLAYSNSPLWSRLLDYPQFPGEELVVVTCPMFPHKIAKGYADPVGQVVKEVNGTPVKNFRHLVELLRDAAGDHLTFRFAENSAEFLAFPRDGMEAATADVMEESGIAPARRGSEDVLAVWKKKAP